MISSRSNKKLPRPALRGRYLAHSSVLRTVLGTIDLVLGFISTRKKVVQDRAKPPRRLLLAVGGHLGDAIIATSLLPQIRSAWPRTEIGVLVGSWSRPVLEGHPDVARIHDFDHWKLNRGTSNPIARFLAHRATRRKALREIVQHSYDVAVDLNPYFPNSIPLLWQAGIPCRIGYVSGGFAPLLTEPVQWEEADRHRADYHVDLLLRAGLTGEGGSPLRYSIPRSADEKEVPASDPRAAGEYVVLHMGSGMACKQWPRERWDELVNRLLVEGKRLVFTGMGAKEIGEAEGIARGRPNCHNLCGDLDWKGFVATVAGAQLMVCVDSVAGHVAASVETPVIVLMSGMNRIGNWVPLGEKVASVTNPVPCAPCYRSRGCREMTCVRGISVDRVMTQLDKITAAAAPLRDSPAAEGSSAVDEGFPGLVH